MIRKIDVDNLVRVESIFEKFGHPNIDSVGSSAAHTPFMVVHHSSLYESRLKHFETFYTAYRKGNLKGGSLEFYLDRMYRIKFRESLVITGAYRIEDKIDTMIVLLDLKDRIQ
ncbi:MAG: hypothetical protein GY816_16900 [Cytophagales bacterium]|nr:hypothetical protein [Cytophagales bacterium]